MSSRRTVALITFAAAAMSILSSALSDIAGYRHGMFAGTPAEILALGRGRAGMVKWADLTDMLGSYLLMAPLAVCLWRRLRDDGGYLVDLAAAAALVYIATGAAGAAVWAGTRESLIRQHAVASGADSAAINAAFASVTYAVAGVWHFCSGPALATYWILIGYVLRTRLPRFALFSIAMGALAGLSSIGAMLVVDSSSRGPVSLLFWPVGAWATWLGVHVWRGRVLDVEPDSAHARGAVGPAVLLDD